MTSRFVLSLLVCLVLLSAGIAQASEEPQKVAVLDFRILEGVVTFTEADYLTDVVRGVTRTALPVDRFHVITRENIEAMLSPEDFAELLNCASDVCEVEAGRKVGADFVVSGHILKFGSGLRLFIKLHETESGNLIATRTIRGSTVENLEMPLNEEAQVLFEELVQDLVEEPTLTPTNSSISDLAAYRQLERRDEIKQRVKENDRILRKYRRFMLYWGNDLHDVTWGVASGVIVGLAAGAAQSSADPTDPGSAVAAGLAFGCAAGTIAGFIAVQAGKSKLRDENSRLLQELKTLPVSFAPTWDRERGTGVMLTFSF